MRPSPSPSLTLPPMMEELPEPSPHSSSLLDNPALRPIDIAEGVREEEDDFVGGTSMLEVPNMGRLGGSQMYAASAPATMLWGPAMGGHRCANASAMGGRTPSKTLLEALSTREA